MKKNDILASIIIGLASALIGTFILNFIEWEIPIIGRYPFILFFLLPAGSLAMIFIAHIMARKIPVLFQIAKCFLAGVLNTLVDLGLFNLLYFVMLPAVFPAVFEASSSVVFLSITVGASMFAAIKAISFSAGAVNSYFWNKYWTFNKRDSESKTKEFGKLYLVTLVGLVINVAAATFVAKYIGPQFELTERIWDNISIVIAAFVAFVWNFAGFKFFVFKK
jgi:putative flippase GtrA